ncbi:MAG: ABC transporter substrate-binding protein [Anaerolineae bacterium]|nr:ABC transporter substrate-binding protein [Anaerolineae bacterium]
MAMREARLVVALGLLALVLLGLGCAPAGETVAGTAASPVSSSAGDDVLRIGVLPLAETVPFYVAQDEGYFEDEGLRVELVPVASAVERDQLMIAGQLDGQVSDLVATVLFNAEEPRLRIVRRARQARPDSHQFAILVPGDSPVRSAADLAGVEIAVSENSVIQYVTERLLSIEGLEAGDVRTVNVPKIPVRMELLTQGKLAAATLPDPMSSLALLQGARLIVDDSLHPEISQSVVAFRADVIEQREDDVARFMAAYERALEEIEADPQRFHDLLVEKGRVPDALRGSYTFPPLPPPSVPTEDEWSDVVAWAQEKGLISAPVAYGDSVDDRFVREGGSAGG